MPKMLILRGNSAGAGSYPDEQGKTIAWPIGALHVSAASDYARRRGYEPVVIDKPGQPQSQHSPQATAALDAFHNDEEVTAFYGFSGGGYNVYHILNRLKEEQRGLLELVVVIGVESNKLSAHALNSNRYNAHWELVYRNDPPPPLTHIDGPRALLAGLNK